MYFDIGVRLNFLFLSNPYVTRCYINMKYSDWKLVFVTDQDFIIIIHRWKFDVLSFVSFVVTEIAFKNWGDNKLSVAKMRVLCWMCSKTGHDKIINDNIWDRVGVAHIVENMVETRPKWFVHGREKTCRLCNKESRSNGG